MPQVLMGFLAAVLSMLLFALLFSNKNEARSEQAQQNGVVSSDEIGCKYFHDPRSGKCFAFCYSQPGIDNPGGSGWMTLPCEGQLMSVVREMQ